MASKVRALYEFWAQNEAELSFQVGEIITVLNRDDEGWWEGELNGIRGLFPSNYVEPVGPGGGGGFASPKGAEGGYSQFNDDGNMGNNNYAANNFGTGTPANTNDTMPTNAGQKEGETNTSMLAPPPGATTKGATPRGGRLSGVVVGGKGPGTASTGGSSKKPKTSKTKFGLFASNMAILSGISSVVLSGLGVTWFQFGSSPLITNLFTLYGCLYGIASGYVSLIFEYFWGDSRGPSPIPFRGLFYVLLAGPNFISWPSMTGGLFFLTVAFFNFVATYNGEVYEAAPKAEEKKHGNFFSDWVVYIVSARQMNRIGTIVFMMMYWGANAAVFATTYILWLGLGAASRSLAAQGLMNPAFVSSIFTPWAKGFGGMLDLNCAIIVIPVCRTIIRWLYSRSTADQSWIAVTLRTILYVVPLDLAIEWHKIIAKVIMFATIGHTVAHFVNFAVTPAAALFTFNGVWPVISGAIVCYFMLFLYSAVWDNVKKGQFEIFWYCHHFFVLFFIVTLVHGKNGLNPNYWKYFVGPGAFYLTERMLRVYRARKKCVLLSVTLMDDVFSMEFAKEGVFAAPYKEGQYLFLNSPPISHIQWHPFTISSAPEDKSVTVHIRVSTEGSWTRGLSQYLAAMGPRAKTFFALDRTGPTGKLPGKIIGPDGKRIICIDGPHSAPTQHLGEYSVAYVCGAGIGATPVSATVKSVVFHKWKYFIGQCFPDHAYYAWVCAHKDIDAFRWLIRIIKEAQDEVVHMRASNPINMASKTFQFHIFLTSTPKGSKPVEVVVDDEIGFWGVPRPDSQVDKIRANWDEADLYKVLKCAPPHTQLGDVRIFEGRPKWDERFNEIHRSHPTGDIGVMFCGAPVVAKQLRNQCYQSNKVRSNGLFRLHKENF